MRPWVARSVPRGSGLALCSGQPGLERAQVTRAAKEVLDELRRRLRATRGEDLVAVAERDRRIHEIAAEGGVQVARDGARPEVRVVRGRVVVAVHVLPACGVRRPLEALERGVLREHFL